MIRFVSLGPGDPELITVKGLRALQEADVIFCPATVLKPAGEKEVSFSSRAAEIVQALGIDPKRIALFHVPMSRDREAARRAYDQLAVEVRRARRKRLEVVVVAEGDAGFYSSIHYLFDKLWADQIEVEQIAGVPAFIAAGAAAGLHIVKQTERLLVIPGTATAYELISEVKEGKVVVIMKLSACQAAVRTCLATHPEFHYYYFEQVGTREERFVTDPTQLIAMSFPYFSLLIIRKPEEQP